MSNKTRFFPHFHHAGLGCKPASAVSQLRAKVRLLDGLCLNHLQALLGHALPVGLVDFKTLQGKNSRSRVFTPVLCFWAFLTQVLDAQGSCRRALARVQALLLAKGLSPVSDDTGAYCKARARLPIRLLYRVQPSPHGGAAAQWR